jgi:hypothetical protein
MANLGNAWHMPGSPEPPRQAGMRDPVCAIAPGTAVTIFSGNQFAGQGGTLATSCKTAVAFSSSEALTQTGRRCRSSSRVQSATTSTMRRRFRRARSRLAIPSSTTSESLTATTTRHSSLAA